MKQTAVFGGGCFWCTEAIFKRLRGVFSVMPGYAGGSVKNPGYYDVVTGETGHAEVIRIGFDPSVITYNELLDVFWHVHNPSSLNRQGADVGTQYRSVILYNSDEQKAQAESSRDALISSGEFSTIVTEIIPLDAFYDAESNHINYFDTHQEQPYCQLVIAPKLQHFLKKYAAKVQPA